MLSGGSRFIVERDGDGYGSEDGLSIICAWLSRYGYVG
jgi:hypothetical protein